MNAERATRFLLVFWWGLALIFACAHFAGAETLQKQADKKVSAVWIVAPMIGQMADLSSTAYGLKRGGQEGNPMLGQGTGIVAAKIGTAVVLAIVVNKLGHHNPKAAKVLSFVTTAYSMGIAAHNLRVNR